ncbi:hypothetical protein C1752_16679 [Acaryochloris thomasi RCC1774]|uniref:Uncharacterized protein n=1 Tax=Acaryochloris thomasi RCC1774 TaxID=1764569 RepID=A0A2W1JEP6_9CYAN|nr:hypothetical protein [Acaryochloris thomasi]PZD70215.1 hypothetical protein C1752_16679 [Acaryochloris thomasi RCC1774]
MKAKEGRGNYSRRTFAPPRTTDPDETRQQWNQRNTEARAVAARERAQERQGEASEEEKSC